jgi:hypothetical protein
MWAASLPDNRKLSFAWVRRGRQFNLAVPTSNPKIISNLKDLTFRKTLNLLETPASCIRRCSLTLSWVYQLGEVEACDWWARKNLHRYRRNLCGEMGSYIFCEYPRSFGLDKPTFCGIMSVPNCTLGWLQKPESPSPWILPRRHQKSPDI